MKIYNANGVEIADVLISDESYRYRALMGEHTLTLIFALPVFQEIPIGAYVDYEGERYTLLKPQNFTKNSSRNFEYTLILESAKALMGRYKMRDKVVNGTAKGGSNRLKFSYTATPTEHLNMLIANLNERDSGWTAGTCISAAEKVISYNHTGCDEALTIIAETFNTEYEVTGKTISIKKVEYNKNLTDALPLAYGMGNGFKSGVKRDNYDKAKIVEILYIQGGEKNINRTTYGSPELLLPKNKTLKYDGAKFEYENGYIQANARTYTTDENGYAIKRGDKALATHIEDSLDLSNIYPSRVGAITNVYEVDANKSFYDFADFNIPTDLDYKAQLTPGEKMTVIFQSGELAGKEFDVAYDHAARRFAIVPQEIDGITMPNKAAGLIPKQNDKYAVFGISLPTAYVCNDATKSGASWDLFREGIKYFYENEDPRFSFTGILDGIWAKKNWLNIGGKIKMGGFVAFRDEQFQAQPVLVRIIAIKDYCTNPKAPEIELSNVTTGGNSLSSALAVIDQTAVAIEDKHKESMKFSKRGFREAKETMAMIQEAMLEGFTDKITPITVQTMQLIAGDESLQFQFVNSKTNPVKYAHAFTYDAEKIFSTEATILQHLTIGIKTISTTHAAAEYKYWDMAQFISPPLTEATKGYYLYAKVSKTATTGNFYLSETPKAINAENGFYHLLVGVLTSEQDGARSWTELYGYTEILPGRITTDRIVSSNGNCYMDLVAEEIAGNIKFKAGTQYKEVGTAIGDAQSAAATDATSKANAAQAAAQAYAQAQVAAMGDTLQNQIDGQIIAWFQDEPPLPCIDATGSMSGGGNYPARDWGDLYDEFNADANKHANDTYTNLTDGSCWRFVWSAAEGCWVWGMITDTATQQALREAAKAKTAADGKMTVFSTQPTTAQAYQPGDLWANATVGSYTNEILRCTTAKAAGQAFNISHWTKASKYTDDTVVNNLKIGGRNLVRNADFSKIHPYYCNDISQIAGNEIVSSGGVDGGAFQRVTFINHTTQMGINPLVINGWKPNTEYTLTFYAKTSCSDANFNALKNYKMGIYWNNQPASLTEIINQTITKSWQKYEFRILTASIVEGTGTIYISLKEGAGAGNVEFDSLQLEIGNKATDFKIAPEDTQALFDEMADDNKLTPIEKQTTKRELDAIFADYSTLSSQCTALGVTNTLSSAYSDLANYINPLIANLTTTTDINGATFRNAFATYATAKATLVNALQAKVQANVDGIQVGGKNLLLDSKEGWNTSAYEVMQGVLSEDWVAGEQYVITLKAIFDGDNYLGLWRDIGYHMCVGQIPHIGNDIYSATFVCPQPYVGQALNTCSLYNRPYQNGYNVKIEWVKIEKGNRRTDYTEAPEDISTRIQAIADKNIALDYIASATSQPTTEINGGFLLTNVLGMKRGDGTIIAGINGIDTANPKDVRFWAGSNFTDRASAPFRVYEDGSVGISNETGRQKIGILTEKLPALEDIKTSVKFTASVGNEWTAGNGQTTYQGTYSYRHTGISAGANGYNRLFKQGGQITTSEEPVGQSTAFEYTFAYEAYIKLSAVAEITDYMLMGAGIGTYVLDIFIKNSAGVKIYSTSAYTKNAQLIDGRYYWEKRATEMIRLDAGKYTIGVETRMALTGSRTFDNYQNWANFSNTLNVYYRYTSSLTLMALNGIAISADETKYLYVSEDELDFFIKAMGAVQLKSQSGTNYIELTDAGLKVRGQTDIPAAIAGASITSSGGVNGYWGKITAGTQIVKTGNDYLVTHGIGDTNYTVALAAKSANMPYFLDADRQANTIKITCAGGFDFSLMRMK